MEVLNMLSCTLYSSKHMQAQDLQLPAQSFCFKLQCSNATAESAALAHNGR